MVYRGYVGWISDLARGSHRSSYVALSPGAWMPAGSTWGTHPAWLSTHTGSVDSQLRDIDVLVIGGGQAGIATARELARQGLRGFSDSQEPRGSYLVLDAEVRPGGAWQHRWPTLTMERVHHISGLPGLPLWKMEPATQAAIGIPNYFTSYEEEFDLPVIRPVLVTDVIREHGSYIVFSTAGTFRAKALVNCTGTWTRPFVPSYPGIQQFAGVQMHTQDYRGPAMFARRRVAVVGGGMSAVQHIAEIAPVAKNFAWYTRREPVWTDRPVLENGLHVEASVRDRVEAGIAPRSVVAETGLLVTDYLRESYENGVYRRKEMFTRIETDGVRDANGDLWKADFILWATGFRPEFRHLRHLNLRNHRGGISMNGTAVATDPLLHLLGYGPTASTVGAKWGARKAVREVIARLGLR